MLKPGLLRCCVFQLFLAMALIITLIFAKEVPYKGNQNLPTKANGQVEAEPTGPLAVFKGFKNLPPGMPSVLLVTGLTWVCDSIIFPPFLVRCMVFSVADLRMDLSL
jgi:hypothetical protein